jgi:hypothetical protein
MTPGPSNAPPRQFKEFKSVRQEPHGYRRWFEGADLELVVWHDETGARTGFQLLYPVADGERALTWHPAKGFAHSRVDSGDHLLRKETPILIADGMVPWQQVEDLFQQNAASLDPDLREFVLGRLKDRR